jgi:hypothetical protein
MQALVRDNYRCVLTGNLDGASVEANLVLDDGGPITTTHAAHIFDRSTNEDLETGKKARCSLNDASGINVSAI